MMTEITPDFAPAVEGTGALWAWTGECARKGGRDDAPTSILAVVGEGGTLAGVDGTCRLALHSGSSSFDSVDRKSACCRGDVGDSKVPSSPDSEATDVAQLLVAWLRAGEALLVAEALSDEYADAATPSWSRITARRGFKCVFHLFLMALSVRQGGPPRRREMSVHLFPSRACASTISASSSAVQGPARW